MVYCFSKSNKKGYVVNREALLFGNLNNGSGNGGLSNVNGNNGLSNATWNIASRLSETTVFTSRHNPL